MLRVDGICEFGGNLHRLCDEECEHCFNRSFASHSKAEFWISEWNDDLTARQVTKNSNEKRWFICDNEECRHSFNSILGDITKGQWCPYCSSPPKKLCDEECDICFNRSFASHPKAQFWHPDKEWNELTPRQIFKSSHQKMWFVCDNDECGHSFNSALNSITNMESWCPYCCDSIQKLCDDDCHTCFNRSFASHSRAEFWHPNKEWNDLSPRQVAKSSNKKWWFICNNEECGHAFNSILGNITRGQWCPYCCFAAKKLCDEDCNWCFNRSFASHPKAQFWHPEWNNGISPRHVTKSSNKKVWFVCNNEECSHSFVSAPNHIVKGQWCSYCAVKKLCDEECGWCFNHSFASHPKAQFWHPEWNGKLTPRQIFKSSARKGWFICDNKDCGHAFNSTLNSISSNGSWCPYCKNKTENILYQWLTNQGFSLRRQAKFNWCKNSQTNRYLPFDFLIGNIIIELDGAQHFRQVANWTPPEITQKRDTYKTRLAIYKGYSVIRLLQSEVWDTLSNQTVIFEGEEPELDMWQIILLEMLSTPPPSPTVTFISGEAQWPGHHGAHILNVSYETVLVFHPAL